jgi:hypothetical protein
MRVTRLLPILALAPGAAHAHLVSTGVGPFYDGMAHLFVSPGDLLLGLALGALVGLGGQRTARAALLAIAAGWGAAAAVGAGLAPLPAWSEVPPLLLLITGTAVALDTRLSAAAAVTVTGAAAAFHGLHSGAALSAGGAVELLGLYTGVLGVVLLSAALVVNFHAGWRRIAVRVAGSWVGAIGLLLLGWTLRSPAI